LRGRAAVFSRVPRRAICTVGAGPVNARERIGGKARGVVRCYWG
jgi:hypothetical protein